MRKLVLQVNTNNTVSHPKARPVYLGETRISQQQFSEIQHKIKAGEKLEAIKLIRMWTALSLADALHIADNFYSIDFGRPQTLVRINERNCNRSDNSQNGNHIKAQKTAKAVCRGVGFAALFGGYGVLRVVSGLVKPYLGKRK